MLGRITRHELRGLAADHALWLVLLVFGALIGYGVFNGARWARTEAAAQHAAWFGETQRTGVLRARLIRIEAGREAPGPPLQDATRPAAVGRALAERTAILPLSPLAPLSIGQADLLPAAVPVTTRTRHGLPGRDEIANPAHLLAGRFDLAFVILFLLPLLVLALGYDMIARERESGTLPLLLSQPLRLRTVVAGKVLARATLILAATFGFAAAGLAAAGVELTSARASLGLALWATIVALYSLFWLMLAALVNLVGRSSAQQAVALAAVWLILAVVVPSGVTTMARVLHPVPSRAAMIGAEREATRLAESEGSGLLARYYEDHPELVEGALEDLDDFLIRSYAVEEEVERRMEPVRRRYEAEIAAQRRVVQRLRFLSPVLLAQDGLNDIAGTGDARHLRFQAQVERFRADFQAFFRPLVYAQERFTTRHVERIPVWRFEDEPQRDLLGRVGTVVLGLLLSTLAITAAAIAMARRFSV